MSAHAGGRRSGLGTRAALVALLLAVAVSAPRAQLLDRVLAVVNGEVVTWLDVKAAIEFRLVEGDRIAGGERAVLEALIDRELMLGDAGRYSVREPDEAEVDRAVEAVRGRFATRQAFETASALSGMTDARLRTAVWDSIRLEMHIEQRFAAAAQPTDDDLMRYYRQHRDELARKGVTPSLDQVRDEVTAKAAAERRAGLVAEWLDRLRQRAEIHRLGEPARR